MGVVVDGVGDAGIAGAQRRQPDVENPESAGNEKKKEPAEKRTLTSRDGHFKGAECDRMKK